MSVTSKNKKNINPEGKCQENQGNICLKSSPFGYSKCLKICFVNYSSSNSQYFKDFFYKIGFQAIFLMLK